MTIDPVDKILTGFVILLTLLVTYIFAEVIISFVAIIIICYVLGYFTHKILERIAK